MHIVIRCEVCGWRQALERELFWPQVIYLICHCCEAPLVVQAATVEAWAMAWAIAHPVHA